MQGEDPHAVSVCPELCVGLEVDVEDAAAGCSRGLGCVVRLDATESWPQVPTWGPSNSWWMAPRLVICLGPGPGAIIFFSLAVFFHSLASPSCPVSTSIS